MSTMPMRWIAELERYLLLKRQFIIYGNIHDLYCGSESSEAGPQPLRSTLNTFFHNNGYDIVAFLDIVDGLQFMNEEDKDGYRRISPEDGKVRHNSAIRQIDQWIDSVRNAIRNPSKSAVVIIDFASLLTSSPRDLEENERHLFLKILKMSHEAKIPKAGEVRNLTVLIADKLNDLPAWLYISNPLCKPIEIERPNEEERKSFLADLGQLAFHHGKDFDVSTLSSIMNTLTDLTAGFMMRELSALRDLSKYSKHTLDSDNDAKALVQLLKFGVRENPWENKRNELVNADSELRKFVKGQNDAIVAVVDILKRASEGLSGVQYSAKAQRPKGVLFFAGPTGVGKTELAKAVATLLFKEDADAFIRFDMSEYSQEHSDQKFFGSPPGYVGYDEGGQLTNRIKAHPFSVLLFDEIEKANPKILDKFLQIIDDGRLTSGQGETVYFSESLIIFTSNKGIYKEIPRQGGGIDRIPVIKPKGWHCGCQEPCWIFEPEGTKHICSKCQVDWKYDNTPYEVINTSVRDALHNYFTLELGRPELYNRIGDNFIVFDFIRDNIMSQIIEKMLNLVRTDLLERRQIDVQFTQPVFNKIIEHSKINVAMGGRGVGNTIEKLIVNPLARYLFDEQIKPNTT